MSKERNREVREPLIHLTRRSSMKPLQAWGIRYTEVTAAAMIMTLESVFGVLISILFYHEIVTAKIAFGFALVFAAVLISELRPFGNTRRRNAEEEPCVN